MYPPPAKSVLYMCVLYASGAVAPALPANVDVGGGVDLELTAYPHNMALICRRTHLPRAALEQGLLSLKLLQRTMSLEKLGSKESLLKS